MPTIHILTRTFPPNPGAVGALCAELAAELAAQGWHVTILTTLAADRPAPAEEILPNGVRVHRPRGLPFTRATHLRRALAYLSIYPAWLLALWRLPSADILLTTTDPPIHALLGPLAQWRHPRMRLVHWCQDLYPELAAALGVIPADGLLHRALRALSTWALRQHHRVIVLGSCMERRLLFGRGLPADKFATHPNWSADDASHPTPAEIADIRQRHGWDGRFVLRYGGNLGLVHTFDAILEAAALLQTTAPRLLLVISGHGPRRAATEARATELGLTNTIFPDLVPAKDYAALNAAVDAHLVTLHPAAAGLVIPSKIYPCLRSGKPVLYIGPPDTEAAQLLANLPNNGAALPPDNPAAIARLLAEWAASPPAPPPAAADAPAPGPKALVELLHDVLAAHS